MTTPIVTREEFLQWIMEQPDEKPLDWGGTFITDDCRCPMAEYNYQKHPNVRSRASCYTTFRVGTETPLWKFEQGFNFTSFYDESCTNYGQLKDSLKQKGLV